MIRRLVASTAALVLLGLGAVPASAADLDSVGWWWRMQTGLLVEAPPPPNVPAGGMSVSAAPDGANAVGAVRFALDADEAAVALTLAVSSQQGPVALVACPTTLRWQPRQAGRWDARPTVACDQVSAAGVEGDGVWTFDVTAFAARGALDVAILPDVPDGGVQPGAFQVDFAAPDASSLETRSTAAPPAPPPPPPPAPTPGPPPATTAPPVTAPSPPTPPGRAPPPVFTAPITPVPAAPSDAPAPVVADPQPPPPASGPDETPVAAPGASQEELDARDREGALTAAAALLLVATTTLWGTRSRARIEEPVEEGGLGRFTQPRTGAPPPLW